jgi:hypothetical protein
MFPLALRIAVHGKTQTLTIKPAFVMEPELAGLN